MSEAASKPIEVTLYADPGCPWGYSALPALRVLDWRYGDQLSWRLVVIGLADHASRYIDLGFTPLRAALGQVSFRRYGMPFAPEPKERVSATGRSCRALVAVRLEGNGEEWRALRALQLATFTTPLLLDDDAQLAAALSTVPGLDGEGIVARLDDPDVSGAYARDKAEARSAAGSPAELQGKTATDGELVRFTAPSLVFEREGQRLVAGGFQPVEAYDVLVANLDPTLTREAPPESPLALLERFPQGVTTQEVAALLTVSNDAPDRTRAETLLLELVAEGQARRLAMGDDALWLPSV